MQTIWLTVLLLQPEVPTAATVFAAYVAAATVVAVSAANSAGVTLATYIFGLKNVCTSLPAQPSLEAKHCCRGKIWMQICSVYSIQIVLGLYVSATLPSMLVVLAYFLSSAYQGPRSYYSSSHPIVLIVPFLRLFSSFLIDKAKANQTPNQAKL